MSEKIKISCIHCGATNNYPKDAMGKKVVCGRCKNNLPQPGEVVEPLSQQFNTLFQHSGLPLLVDFYSPTCAPCQVMHPILENLAQRRAGELMVVKVNVDQNPELASAFGVQGVPTFVVLFKGNERQRSVGGMPEADFSLWVASLV